MTSFRFLCIAVLAAVMLVAAAAGGASAQTAPATVQSSKHYLAGLRPPHDQKPAQLKTSHATDHRTTAKSTRLASKQKLTVTHRPARLADKINSRVAWPSVDSPAPDERATSDTVLQFATEDAGPKPATAPHPTLTVPTDSTVKTLPPATIAATDERNRGSMTADTAATASTPVQTKRFEAPPSSQMRVIMPAPNAEPLIASTPSGDEPPARSNSSMAELLVTLAGAITAGVVGWLMIGFGPFRAIKSRQT